MTYKELRKNMLNMDKKDFTKYLEDNLIIKRYLPIGQKNVIIDVCSHEATNIIESRLEDGYSNLTDIYIDIEMIKIFDFMFRYINVDFDVTYRSYSEYDLIMQSGFYNYVMFYIEKDYNYICKIFDKVMGLDQLSLFELLNNKLKTPNEESINELISTLDKIKNTDLTKFEHLLELNDPLNAKVTNIIRNNVYNGVKNEIQK